MRSCPCKMQMQLKVGSGRRKHHHGLPWTPEPTAARRGPRAVPQPHLNLHEHVDRSFSDGPEHDFDRSRPPATHRHAKRSRDSKYAVAVISQVRHVPRRTVRIGPRTVPRKPARIPQRMTQSVAAMRRAGSHRPRKRGSRPKWERARGASVKWEMPDVEVGAGKVRCPEGRTAEGRAPAASVPQLCLQSAYVPKPSPAPAQRRQSRPPQGTGSSRGMDAGRPRITATVAARRAKREAPLLPSCASLPLRGPIR